MKPNRNTQNHHQLDVAYDHTNNHDNNPIPTRTFVYNPHTMPIPPPPSSSSVQQQQPPQRATVTGTILSKLQVRIRTIYETIVRDSKSIGKYFHLPIVTSTTGTTTCCCGSLTASLSLSYYWWLGTVVASVFLVTGVLVFPTTNDEIPSYRVAFLGNSVTFVNDLPRFMVELSNAAASSSTGSTSSPPKMIQNSCLHSSLSFRSFLQKGNGMYHKWQTSNALLFNLSSSTLFPYYEDGTTMINDDVMASTGQSDDDNNDDDGSDTSRILIYDYGACTVNQLLFGYDDDLVEDNANGKYKNDGSNPCIQDSNYLHYLQAKYLEEKLNETGTTLYTKTTSTTKRRSLQTKWDYVVMNDQTVYPGIASKRKRSIRALTKTYSKLFLKTKTSIPVFLATYGYMKSNYYYATQQHSYYSRSSSNSSSSSSTNKSSSRSKNYKSKKYQNGYGSTDDDAVTDDAYSYENYTDPTYDYLGDMVHFTSRTWYGYQQYANELGQLLPSSQQPIVAPIGPAFLLLYEENYNMWETKLFYDDGYHPSPMVPF